MQHKIEQIKKRIDEIRNICALQEQIMEVRASLGDLDRQSLALQERVRQIEKALKIPPKPSVAAPPAMAKDPENVGPTFV